MKNAPITSENPDLPIVKIGWIRHNRKYEIGIQRFLEVLGVEATSEEILAATKKLLSLT